jgi:tRNA(Ile)-lysidine synthase
MTATGARSPAGGNPPPELVARFKEALERLWPEGGKLGLAVSGGPDSMAMLLLAEAAIPGRFEVATVDHGLRPESAEECAMVTRICAARDIPCETVPVIVGEGNLQEEAREARYAAMAVWCERRKLRALATAHHADDQTETLVMRLNRASGLAGLAGVRERLYIEELEITLVRPVLGFRRAELASIVEIAGLEAVRDPSNEDDSFDRVRVRKALVEADWIDPIAWAQSASHLAVAEEAIDYLAHQSWAESMVREDGGIRIKGPHWRAVELRLFERAIRELGGKPRGMDVARLHDRVQNGGGGNVAGVQVTYEYEPSEGVSWLFRPEPPRRTG